MVSNSMNHANGSTLLPIDLPDEEVNQLCDSIRETGYALHRFFGPGFREKVYERGLIHRLRKRGMHVDVQPHVVVCDEDGTELIEEILDLVVERVVIVELKAVRATSDADVSQLLGYLRATQFRHGLLINFGASRFSIRKYVR